MRLLPGTPEVSKLPALKNRRRLTEMEISLINDIVSLGDYVRDRLMEVEAQDGVEYDPGALQMAFNEIQSGFMWAVRSVEKPDTFC